MQRVPKIWKQQESPKKNSKIKIAFQNTDTEKEEPKKRKQRCSPARDLKPRTSLMVIDSKELVSKAEVKTEGIFTIVVVRFRFLPFRVYIPPVCSRSRWYQNFWMHPSSCDRSLHFGRKNNKNSWIWERLKRPDRKLVSWIFRLFV